MQFEVKIVTKMILTDRYKVTGQYFYSSIFTVSLLYRKMSKPKKPRI